ncbi:hypothetical protein KKH82_05685 [Patescibacteria group bacterium]|nr:hypothetical protein [Patescibacteria group bacterium]
MNQTFSFDLIDDGAQDRALDNKLTLTYIEERTDFTNLAESYYSVLKNIPMESQNLIEYT